MLIKLTERLGYAAKGDIGLINPHYIVKALRYGSKPEHSILYFNDGNELNVMESLDEIQALTTPTTDGSE